MLGNGYIFGRGNVPRTLEYYISNIEGASVLIKLVIIYSRVTEKYLMQNLGNYYLLI